MRNWIPKLLSPIALLILVNVILGSFIFNDYGESWDENRNYLYAEKVVYIYQNVFEGGERNYGPNNKGYYGPFFMTLSEAIDQLIRPWFVDLLSKDVYHALYFGAFLLAVFSIYVIGKRFLSTWGAFGVALLFNTQPIFFGHAFINPKDIPFMAFFLASIASGMWMLDAFPAESETAGSEYTREQNPFSRLLQNDWRAINSRVKRNLMITITVWFVLLGGYGLFGNVLDAWAERLVTSAYEAGDATTVGRLFDQYAANKADVPLDAYVQKAATWISIAANLALGIGLLGVLVLWIVQMHSVLQWLWRDTLKPVLQEFDLQLPKKIVRNFSKGSLWAAGIALGLCTSIRVLGPAAGGLIALYFLMKRKESAVAPLLAYAILGGAVTYFTWPILWDAPVRRYIEAIQFMSNFPWPGNVLFEGILYDAGLLPRWFLPKLLFLQFTWPVMVLFLLGFGLGIIRVWKRELGWPVFALLTLWFWGPFILFLAVKPVIYDNFRQFFFILPPIFLFGGISLEYLFKKIAPVWGRVALLVLLVVPGVAANVCLHPYQYAYYNQLAGGVAGAYRRYELDYWTTSYSEAIEYLNANAEQDARVIAWGPAQIVDKYAREDLEVVAATALSARDSADDSVYDFDYAVQTTRRNLDLANPVDGEVVFQVERDGAVFVLVTRLP